MRKLFFIFLITIAFGAKAQNQSFREKNHNIESNKLAINGYDPVAYFSMNKAVKGKPQFKLAYAGVMYQFSTKENLELFKKEPTHYEPQYGGWCAYAMGATGEKVEVDPETFKIIDSRLYLFYNKLFNNTLPDWSKNEVQLKASADKNWSRYR